MAGQWTDGILAAVDAESCAEAPIDSPLNGMIEDIRQERNDRETEL